MRHIDRFVLLFRRFGIRAAVRIVAVAFRRKVRRVCLLRGLASLVVAFSLVVSLVVARTSHLLALGCLAFLLMRLISGVGEFQYRCPIRACNR